MKNIDGNLGEQLVCNFLKKQGYVIASRNYKCRFGEIDIIATNREYLSFIEVKTRKNSSFAEAREYVDYSKQQRIITTAELWMSLHPMDLQPRFDVAEVYIDPENGENHRICFFPDAFSIK